MDQWLTPPVGEDELCLERTYGKGRIVYLAGYPGNGYNRQYCAGFEQLLKSIVMDSGVALPAEVISPLPGEKNFIYIKSGHADGTPLLFVFFPEGVDSARLKLAPALFPHGTVEEVLSGQSLTVPDDGSREIEVRPGKFNIAVLALRK